MKGKMTFPKNHICLWIKIKTTEASMNEDQNSHTHTHTRTYKNKKEVKQDIVISGVEMKWRIKAAKRFPTIESRGQVVRSQRNYSLPHRR